MRRGPVGAAARSFVVAASGVYPLDDLFTDRPDLRPFTADDSGVARYPWQPLPGTSPAADARHGVYGFDEPDDTDPALATASQWRAVKGTEPPAALGLAQP